MSGSRTPPREEALIAAARDGDHDAYARLVEDRRAELHAHCYRMLGSVHDADDALQDALLRAWRGLPRFDGRSSLRTWLYRIATNTSLDVIAKRPARTLPIDRARAADPREPLGEPLTEQFWIDAYPDADLAIADDAPTPGARYEQRESVELAFVAALQTLPPRGRAALVMRDVLGFSARETADALDASVPSVNSALQRARDTMDRRGPEHSQQAVLRSLGDERTRRIVQDYADAMERGDVEAVVALLTDDATWSMPPLAAWFRGEGLVGFLRRYAFSVRWRHLPVRASGQVAVGCYAQDPRSGRWLASVIDVLTLEGGRVAAVTAFGTPAVFRGLADPTAPRAVSELFARFGMPDALPGR